MHLLCSIFGTYPAAVHVNFEENYVTILLTELKVLVFHCLRVIAAV